MSSFHLKVSAVKGEMKVTVDHGLSRSGYPGLYLRSSVSAAPVLDEAHWPLGLPWCVADRLRGRGASKGRVLAVWQELGGRDPVPVAAAAWHAHETGPLYVFDLGHSSDVQREVGELLENVLLDALLEAARHHKAPVHRDWHGQLRWSQIALARVGPSERNDYRRANLGRAKTLGFTKYVPPPLAAEWTKGAWLGVRRF